MGTINARGWELREVDLVIGIHKNSSWLLQSGKNRSNGSPSVSFQNYARSATCPVQFASADGDVDWLGLAHVDRSNVPILEAERIDRIRSAIGSADTWSWNLSEEDGLVVSVTAYRDPHRFVEVSGYNSKGKAVCKSTAAHNQKS